MDAKFILGILISIFSLALVFIGITAQIIKNYKEKRSGQPLITILIMVGFYICQIAFFAITQAYLPMVTFILGFFAWSTVLGQYIIYHKNK
jgi:hypothetical protein